MAVWTFGTTRQDHIDEHNKFDHTDLATLTTGKVLGVSGGLIKQLDIAPLAVGKRITVAASPYSVTAADSIIIVDSSGGAVIVNLPSSASVDLQGILIKRIGTNPVTINRGSIDMINTDGATSTSRTLGSDGAQWSAVASNAATAWYTVGQHGTVT